jgi:hypothetical protein
MQGQTRPDGAASQDLANDGKGDMAEFSVRPSRMSSAWDVVDITLGRLVSTHDTNRGAWYAADKLNREARNRSQDVSDWSLAKRASDE